jgi:hypothetical protein
MTSTPLTIIIVEKNADLRLLKIKDYKEDELYKKCGFKKGDDFLKHNEWTVKLGDNKYYVSMYGKINGKANMENKYDFPPPIDTKLFFGCCALVCHIKDKITNNKVFTNLSLELWSKIYEKLFGGFEDLNSSNEDEEDELDTISDKMKTKNGGYLKDGFVVDDDDDVDDDDGYVEDNEYTDEEEDEYYGSELSEEKYDYSDDDNIYY